MYITVQVFVSSVFHIKLRNESVSYFFSNYSVRKKKNDTDNTLIAGIKHKHTFLDSISSLRFNFFNLYILAYGS